MRSRGAILIFVILGLALSATLGSLWFRHHETWRALEFWGPEAAQAIAGAERVEALRLAPVEGHEADLTADGQRLRVVAHCDVMTAPGFTNARDALTLNRSFDWPPSGGTSAGCRPVWTYALRFTRGGQTAIVLLSIDCPVAMLAGGDRQVGIGPIVAGLKTLLERQQSWQSP